MELNQLKNSWEQKPLHGQYAQRIRNTEKHIIKTNQWPKRAGLKAETEGLIITAQDQSPPTRNYQAYIIKNGSNQNCTNKKPNQ